MDLILVSLEMDSEQKNSISQGGLAMKKAVAFLGGIEMESGVTAFGWLDYVVWVFYTDFMAILG